VSVARFPRMVRFYSAPAGWLGLAVAAAGFAAARADNAAVADLPGYQRSAGEVAGSLKCVGSDTMNNLVALWAEGFKKFYPSVREGIEGKGSASAPPALAEGTCSFGPMSRDWKPSEIDAFKAKHGYDPTVVPVAIDMLVVFVHKDNPLESLSLQQPTFAPGAISASRENGRTGRSASTAATPPAAPTATSRSSPFSRATSSRRSRSSREVRPSCRRWPATGSASATAGSAT